MKLLEPRNGQRGRTKARVGDPIVSDSYLTVSIEIGGPSVFCSATVLIGEKWMLDQLLAFRLKRIEQAKARDEAKKINHDAGIARIKVQHALLDENKALKDEVARLKGNARVLG